MSEQEQQPAEEPQEEKDRPVLEYSSPGAEAMEPVARFFEPLMAHLAASKLEEAGIPCRVTEDFHIELLYRRTAELLVARRDRQQAVEVLAQTPARGHLLADPSELPPLRAAPIEACPGCGSQDKALAKPTSKVLVGLGVLSPLFIGGTTGAGLFIVLGCMWLAFCFVGRPWQCKACGHRWSSEDIEEDEADAGDASKGGQV